MKKTSTLLVILILAMFSGYSQDLREGTPILGGMLSFTRQSSDVTGMDKVKTTYLNLHPSIGKFYRNNRSAGIALIYSGNKSSDDINKANFYGLGIFLRQYLPIGNSFYLFAEEGASGTTGKSTQTATSTPTNTVTRQTAIGIYVYPGLAYSVTKKFQIELAITSIGDLYYRNDKYTSDNGTSKTVTTNNSVSLEAGNSNNSFATLSFGAKWLLN